MSLTGTPTVSRAPRAVLLTLMATIFIALMGVGFVIPFLPVLASDLGASEFALGVLAAVFALSMGLSQPLAGSLSDRYGRKRFLLVGLGIFSVCGFAYTVASSVLDITAIRFIQGVGAGMVFPVAMAYMGDLAPSEYEGRYMAAFNVSLLAGIGSGPLLGGILKDTFGISAAFYAMGSFGALALLLALLVLPESRPGQMSPKSESILRVFRSILADRRMRGILLVRMGVMLAIFPSFVFLPVLMTDVMGASGTQIGVVITVRTLLSAALQFPFGWLADRYSRLLLTLVSILGMAAAVSGFGLSTQFWQTMLIFTAMGVMEAAFMPTTSAMALEGGRTFGMGSTMGVFNTAMNGGMFFGALAAGLLVGWFGFGPAFLIIGVAVAFIGLAAAPMMHSPRGEQLVRSPL